MYGCVCVYLRKKKMRREVIEFVVHREERKKNVRT